MYRVLAVSVPEVVVPNWDFGYGELNVYEAVKRAMEYPYGGCPTQPLPASQCNTNGTSTNFSVSQNLTETADAAQEIEFFYENETALPGQFGEPDQNAGERFRLCVYDTVDDVAVPSGAVLNSGFELGTADDLTAGQWSRVTSSGAVEYRFVGPSIEGNDGIVRVRLNEGRSVFHILGNGAAMPLSRVRSKHLISKMYEAADGLIVQAHSSASGACWGAHFRGDDIKQNTNDSFFGIHDIIEPRVSVEQAAGQQDPVVAAPAATTVHFTAVFSEQVYGLSGESITLGGTAGPTTAVVTRSGETTYDIAVSGMTDYGTVTASIGAGVTEDFAGNPNTASTSIDNQVTLHRYTIATAVTPDQSGSLTCDPNPVAHGDSSDCNATAASGYAFLNFSGDCTGTDPRCTLTDITTATVTAHFGLIIDGVCGGSDGGIFTAAPDTALCEAGSATSVIGNGPWSWSCEGENGGATDSCSANIQRYNMATAASPTGGGSVICAPNPVEHGGSSNCTATANIGYQFTTWSGDCSGTTCDLTSVDGTKTVGALFERDPSFGYTCTPTPGPATVTPPAHQGNAVVESEAGIVTDGAVIVPSGVSVSYMAGDSITLKENFHAENGSRFQAIITDIGCGP